MTLTMNTLRGGAVLGPMSLSGFIVRLGLGMILRKGGGDNPRCNPKITGFGFVE